MEIEVNVPDGKSGPWEISTFTVSDNELAIFNMRAMWEPGRRTMKAGTYKRLTRNGSVIMSNTPAEISDHLSFISRARITGGNILVNGLGLGVALKAILESDTVTRVTVVELSEDVIRLVAPTYLVDPRVEVVHSDAMDWKPPKGVRYTCVWNDIWDNITPDNLPEMTKLHRKYVRRCDWQGSWCKSLCQRYAR